MGITNLCWLEVECNKVNIGISRQSLRYSYTVNEKCNGFRHICVFGIAESPLLL